VRERPSDFEGFTPREVKGKKGREEKKKIQVKKIQL
jgi:hypothetical protein